MSLTHHISLSMSNEMIMGCRAQTYHHHTPQTLIRHRQLVMRTRGQNNASLARMLITCIVLFDILYPLQLALFLVLLISILIGILIIITGFRAVLLIDISLQSQRQCTKWSVPSFCALFCHCLTFWLSLCLSQNQDQLSPL